MLDRDTAIEHAKRGASHLIRDGTIETATAESTQFMRALQHSELTYPIVPPFRPPDELPVWLVYLHGLFYDPQGPPSSSHIPGQPVCSRITVILDSDTYETILLNLAPAEGCSSSQ